MPDPTRQTISAKKRAKLKKIIDSEPTIEIFADVNSKIKDGDKITIKGIKLLENGTIERNCLPGEETVLTAKIINK